MTQISLNGARSADDIDMNGYNHSAVDNMTYNSGDKHGEVIRVMDFYNYEYFSSWYDSDGVDGGGDAKFQQYLLNEDTICMELSRD